LNHVILKKAKFEEKLTQKKIYEIHFKGYGLTLEALLRNLSKSSSTAALDVLIGISTNVFESWTEIDLFNPILHTWFEHSCFTCDGSFDHKGDIDNNVAAFSGGGGEGGGGGKANFQSKCTVIQPHYVRKNRVKISFITSQCKHIICKANKARSRRDIEDS
jgi:hypothetical protein